MGSIFVSDSQRMISRFRLTARSVRIKYRVTQKEECGGGPAFNAAYLCAMWGEKVELISRIGNDTYGKRLLGNCCTGWDRNQLSDQG